MTDYEVMKALKCIANGSMHPIDAEEIKVTEKDGIAVYECPEKSLQKGTVCDDCVCVRMSNYEIAKRRTQKGFCNYDHQTIAEKLGLQIDETYIYLDYFERQYRVNRQNGFVYFKDACKEKKDSPYRRNAEGCDNSSGNDSLKPEVYIEADFDDVMTIYDILCYSKPGATPAGDYILLHQLSKVENATSYAGSGMWGKQEKALSGKLDKLADVCEQLKGEPYGKGDVSYRFEVFRGMKVIFSYWDEDEDFPPQIQFLCDKNSLDYMHFETCWYMISGLLTRIMHEF